MYTYILTQMSELSTMSTIAACYSDSKRRLSTKAKLCLIKGKQEQRTGQDPDKTQEKQGQEIYHSTQSLHENVAPKPISTTTNIKWPPSKSIGDWKNFDKDVGETVRLSSKGNIEARLDLLTVIITNFAAERFGYKEPRQPKVPYKMNRRAEKIKKIRGELRLLKKKACSRRTWCAASPWRA